jgi:hypothetical protein
MERDVFDYIDDEEEAAATPRDRTTMVWNVLTVLVLLSAVCVAAVFLTVFINPHTGINPFPPPTMPVLLELDTPIPPTPTPKSVLPPTWTPTATLPEPTATNTPELVEEEPVPPEDEPGNEGEAEENPEIPVAGGSMPVVLHEGSPNYVPSNSVNFNLSCEWMGVVGQVIDIDGAPVIGLIVELGGSLDGTAVGDPALLTSTGLAKTYGEGGYEFTLADKPIASTQTLWVRVLDQAGLPLSEKFYFDTFSECDTNMAIIYFKQVK